MCIIFFSLLEREGNKDDGRRRYCTALYTQVPSEGIWHQDRGGGIERPSSGISFCLWLRPWKVFAVSTENFLCSEVLSCCLFHPPNHILIQVIFTGFVLFYEPSARSKRFEKDFVSVLHCSIFNIQPVLPQNMMQCEKHQ